MGAVCQPMPHGTIWTYLSDSDGDHTGTVAHFRLPLLLHRAQSLIDAVGQPAGAIGIFPDRLEKLRAEIGLLRLGLFLVRNGASIFFDSLLSLDRLGRQLGDFEIEHLLQDVRTPFFVANASQQTNPPEANAGLLLWLERQARRVLQQGCAGLQDSVAEILAGVRAAVRIPSLIDMYCASLSFFAEVSSA